MSTNKTQNYNLHSWVPTDDFLRAEMNENFTKLDGELLRRYPVVVGSYTGNGAKDRFINLGAPVAAVLVEHEQGDRSDYDHSYVYGGLALTGTPIKNNGVVVQGNGFRVSSLSASDPRAELRTNSSGTVYRYVAWLEC